MKTPDRMRAKRVGQALREEVALMLSGRVNDPDAAGAVVTRVEMNDDLRSARVFVRLFEGGEDPGRRGSLLAALRRAGGLIRRETTRRLRLRYAPDIVFAYDGGVDHMSQIERVLAEIESERKPR
jgi:ribosome-binding factor A